jgi:hypothetical protein
LKNERIVSGMNLIVRNPYFKRLVEVDNPNYSERSWRKQKKLEKDSLTFVEEDV